MTRPEALLDAALTVQLISVGFKRSEQWRAVQYIAGKLHCAPTWDAIEAAMMRYLLAEDAEPMRRAA
jgi:hypothetical protein